MGYYENIIIGAGPAGLFCAANLSDSVLVIEKMKKAGQKLLLSGLGQCNFTHTGKLDEFLTHYGDHGSFLKPAFHEFSNEDCMEYFAQNGIPNETTEEGKVFPKSRNANDILNVLLKKSSAELHLGESILRVRKDGDKFQVQTSSTIYTCKHLIIATGGKSYSHTGSDGSGYHLAESLGHTIVRPKEALTPVYVENFALGNLSGISIPDASIQIWHAGKKMKTHRGDVLITRFGFSGPGILDASRWIQKGDIVKIAFVSLSEEEFEEYLMEKATKEGGKLVANALLDLAVPDRIIKALVPGTIKCSQMTVTERRELVKAFCSYSVTVEKTGGFSVAMATAGGVSLDEVNKKTCESKICPNLFFAGEVLDIDGDTGGYNIQAAFSTAYLVARKIKEKARNND